MLLISSTAFLLLAIAYFASRRFENQSFHQPHNAMLRLGVQIICGDCSGDADRPLKTYLDQFGRCAQCGGRSYVLASAYAQNRLRAMTPAAGEITSHPRRPAFGCEVSLHAVRIHKIGA